MEAPERIETERLVLRKLRMEDAPVIFETYAQDPEVTRYLVWRPQNTWARRKIFYDAVWMFGQKALTSPLLLR